MSAGFLTVILIISLFLLLSTGFPVAFTLIGISTIFFLILKGPATLYLLFSVTFSTATKDIYIAAPLFVVMACILQFSGLAAALYDAMYKWFAGLRGGLAIGSVLICSIMAAMTGLGATGTITMGILAYPEMRKRGYDKSMSLGCISFGGALGPLIPPSVLMIILGGLASISVGKLFMGGVFPGLIASFLACCYIAIKCFFDPKAGPALPREERATWREKFYSLIVVLPTISLILLVLGTLWSGICTPTEAASFGALGALICAAIYRHLNWPNLKDAALLTLRVTVMVEWLLIGGGLFASFVSMSGISEFVAGFLSGAMSPSTALIIMMIIPLILGMLMDGAAITMICIPIFMPVVQKIGIDPLWFALLFTVNVIIGYISPPFGMNLFYLKGVVPADITMTDIYRSAWIYCGILLITLVLCFVFPPILIWLPSMMVGK